MSSPDLFSDASSQELHSIIYRLLQQHRRNGDRLRSIAVRYHNTHPEARLDKSIPKDLRAEAFTRFCPRGTNQGTPSSPDIEDGQAVLEKARGMLRADPHSAANLCRARQLLRQGAVPLINACAEVDRLDAATAMVEAVAAERWRRGLDREVGQEALDTALDWAWKDPGPDADVVEAVLLTATLETALERFYLLPPKPMARRNRNDPEHTSKLDSSQLGVDPLFADDATSQRDDSRNLERDWVHDRFEDDEPRQASHSRGQRSERLARRSPDIERESGYKIRVENLHYELTEDDIYELFERIGPVENARLMYDRHDRSEGVAYVTYRTLADARVACREYDGANAHGQPIRLSIVPPGPAPRRNSFDTAQRPSRSLFDRIESRDRSLSPERGHRSDVTKPPPAGIDRYVPGESSGRRRSPPPPRRRGGGREAGRRPGERRGGGRGGRPRGDDDGRPVVQGRPRKTQEELDAEMEDYWGVGHDGAADAPINGSGEAQGAPANPAISDDIEMEVE
ncbi:hypothetical protein BKA80DRAFT_313348 [Phyllosticta citrichinensis]